MYPGACNSLMDTNPCGIPLFVVGFVSLPNQRLSENYSFVNRSVGGGLDLSEINRMAAPDRPFGDTMWVYQSAVPYFFLYVLLPSHTRGRSDIVPSGFSWWGKVEGKPIHRIQDPSKIQ